MPGYPLEIESIETAPISDEEIVVHLSGQWTGHGPPVEGRACWSSRPTGTTTVSPWSLSNSDRARTGRETGTRASTLPASFEHRLDGHMSLWLGNIEISLPPMSRNRHDPAHDDEPEAGWDDHPSFREEPEAVFQSEAEPGTDELPTAPAADAATVSALRAELHERTASEAQLRGMLARAQAELESRAAGQARLEDAQAELRTVLDERHELVERHSAQRGEVESKAMAMAAELADLEAQLEQERDTRTELESRAHRLAAELAAARGELAEARVGRDAARAEAVALRAEIERVGAERAAAPEPAEPDDGGRGEVEAMVVEARELRVRLANRHGGEPSAGE